LTLGVTSKVDRLDQPYVLLPYIYIIPSKILSYFISYSFYGLLADHISSVITLLLTMSFVDGSP
jgi:hypothetical protein